MMFLFLQINYVSIDFIVLDIECNPSCPIFLGRPFLRTIGAVIDMKEGNIKFKFPLTLQEIRSIMTPYIGH